MKHNSYNNVAWCYDVLAFLIFGNTIKKAQVEVLGFIPPGSRILIAGGGTGWILEKITEIHSSGLSITYIDASRGMIERSKERNVGLNEIHFIAQPIEASILEADAYDVLITSFFFDNFNESDGRLIFEQLHTTLKKEGKWLFTDFILNTNTAYWQKLLLSLMYIFFKWACRIKTRKLFAVSDLFLSFRYINTLEKKYYKSFISSLVYSKAV